jgi:hypothetical protein
MAPCLNTLKEVDTETLDFQDLCSIGQSRSRATSQRWAQKPSFPSVACGISSQSLVRIPSEGVAEIHLGKRLVTSSYLRKYSL